MQVALQPVFLPLLIPRVSSLPLCLLPVCPLEIHGLSRNGYVSETYRDVGEEHLIKDSRPFVLSTFELQECFLERFSDSR